MTAIGILNIVFGALGTLIFSLMVLGAGFLTAAGASSTTEEAGMLAMGGGILMLIGVVGLAINLMLLASGIGVLKVAPWGRMLSIIYGGLGLVVYGGSLATAEFSITTVVALGYCVLLLALCFTPGWRAAFSGSAGEATDDVEEHHGQHRRAA
jgi:hypothetical protein